MRLWHKDLISVLPRQQLLGQWRECCLIARNIAKNGATGHILVNKIMDYPHDEFNAYADAVYKEMVRRGYKTDSWRFFMWRDDVNTPPLSIIFRGWHNTRYLTQCYYNLEEKYDCGGISEEEMEKIARKLYIVAFDTKGR